MPSRSLTNWRTDRLAALNEIEHAHRRVGGSERGRRYATQQINYSYAVLLSSNFQGFCRDLHSECVDHLAAAAPPALRALLRVEFVWNRSLDRGNPHPGAIGSDFNRLGVDFWIEVHRLDGRNQRRRQLLQELMNWRNAIAHQDFDPVGGDPTLHLARVRAWRRSVNRLADHFDLVMYNHLHGLAGGHAPW